MILGLDNAGKTTVIKKLSEEDISTITPTQARLNFGPGRLLRRDSSSISEFARPSSCGLSFLSACPASESSLSPLVLGSNSMPA